MNRSAINMALDRGGFGGQMRFRSMGEALARALDILAKFGIEPDEVVNSWTLKSPKGSTLISLAWTNEKDPFSPTSIREGGLYLSWTELEPKRFEVIGYIS